MHILFVSRSTLFSQAGGDTVQVVETAKHLEKLGYTIEICINKKPQNKNFDLIHFFNLGRPADILPYFKYKKPIVISSIYVDYSEVESLHKDLSSNLRKFFGHFQIEYLKTIARWLKGKEQFPGMAYLLLGQKKSIQKILNHSQYLITTSVQEKEHIQADFKLNIPFAKISLGSEHIPYYKPTKKREGIVCAARIELLKNQLSLITIAEKLKLDLQIIGKPATHQKNYFEQCKNTADKHTLFKGQLKPNDIALSMANAQVHAMPSYYETTGLSTIEALKLGAQVVISTRGAQKEIFGKHAFYCEPSSLKSIEEAILKALNTHTNHSEWVQKNFSWERASHEINDIYQSILSNKKP